MMAVRHAAFIDIRTKEATSPFDGIIDFRVFDVELLREGDKRETPVACCVERTVAGVHPVELAAVEVRISKRVAPTSAAGLSHCRFDRKFSTSRQNEFIAGGVVIDSAGETVHAVAPALVPNVSLVTRFELRTSRLNRWPPG